MVPYFSSTAFLAVMTEASSPMSRASAGGRPREERVEDSSGELLGLRQEANT